MHKHKLIALQKIIEEKIGSLREEVEIATNVKLNPLYIADRNDEIEFLQWIIRTIILFYIMITKNDNSLDQPKCV
jgi:hypothetical protein